MDPEPERLPLLHTNNGHVSINSGPQTSREQLEIGGNKKIIVLESKFEGVAINSNETNYSSLEVPKSCQRSFNCNCKTISVSIGAAVIFVIIVGTIVLQPKIDENLNITINREISKASNSLKDRYRATLKQDNPLVWLDIGIDINKNYVELDFAELDDRGDEIDQPTVGLHHLYRTLQSNNRLLIRGEAGSGKTTLCHRMTLDWANADGQHEFFNSIQILILFHLQELTGSHQTLTEALLDLIPLPGNDRTSKALREYGYKFLLILDGLDEVNETRKDEVKNLLNGIGGGDGFFFNTKIIVTTRLFESFYDSEQINLSNLDLIKHFEVRFKIKPLCKENQLKLVHNSFKDKNGNIDLENPRLKAVEKFINATPTNNYSPFLLFLICAIHSNNDSKQISFSSHFELLYIVMDWLGRNYNSKIVKETGSVIAQSDRDQILFEIGRFFAKKKTYHYSYPENELKDVFMNKATYVLKFGLFSRATSPSSSVIQSSNLIVEVNHKILYDFLILFYFKTSYEKGESFADFLAFNHLRSFNLKHTDSFKRKYHVIFVTKFGYFKVSKIKESVGIMMLTERDEDSRKVDFFMRKVKTDVVRYFINSPTDDSINNFIKIHYNTSLQILWQLVQDRDFQIDLSWQDNKNNLSDRSPVRFSLKFRLFILPNKVSSIESITLQQYNTLKKIISLPLLRPFVYGFPLPKCNQCSRSKTKITFEIQKFPIICESENTYSQIEVKGNETSGLIEVFYDNCYWGNKSLVYLQLDSITISPEKEITLDNIEKALQSVYLPFNVENLLVDFNE